MRLLVTGSNGAVGSMVVREMLGSGDVPIGYDLSRDRRFSHDIDGKFESVSGDVLDWPRLQRTIEEHRPDAIVHTAYLLPDLAQANPFAAVQVNVVGTSIVAELARQNGLRLVFTSTKGTMADFTGEHGPPAYKAVNEDYPVIQPDNRHSLYNDTKVFNEHYLHKLGQISGLDYVILRFGSMYGPGRVRHGGRAVASEMIEAAFDGRPYELESGGDERDDMVYLRDVARACVLAARATTLIHRTFLIATGELVTLHDVAAEVRKHLPEADIRVGPGLDPFKIGGRSYALFDISRARAELDYEPAFRLPEAVDDYLATLRTLETARS